MADDRNRVKTDPDDKAKPTPETEKPAESVDLLDGQADNSSPVGDTSDLAVVAAVRANTARIGLQTTELLDFSLQGSSDIADLSAVLDGSAGLPLYALRRGEFPRLTPAETLVAAPADALPTDEIAPGRGTPDITAPVLRPLSTMSHPVYGASTQVVDAATGRVETRFADAKSPFESISYTPGPPAKLEAKFREGVDAAVKADLQTKLDAGQIVVGQSADGRTKQRPDGLTELTPSSSDSDFKKIVFKVDGNGRTVIDAEKSELSDKAAGKDKNALVQEIQKGDKPLDITRENGVERKTYASGKLETSYSPPGPDGLSLEISIPANADRPTSYTERQYSGGNPPGVQLVECETKDAQGRITSETETVDREGVKTKQTRYPAGPPKDGAVVTELVGGSADALRGRPYTRAEFNPATNETKYTKDGAPVTLDRPDQAIATFRSPDGRTRTQFADGRTEVTYPPGQARIKETFYPPADRQGRLITVEFNPARNNGLATESISRQNDGTFIANREFRPPQADGVSRTSTRSSDAAGTKVIETVCQGADSRGAFTRKEWEGPAERGKVAQTLHSDGTVTTTFAKGEPAKAVFTPANPPKAAEQKFYDNGNPAKELTGIDPDKLIAKTEKVGGKDQLTMADGRKVTDQGGGVTQIEFPSNDKEGRVKQIKDTTAGTDTTEFRDRVEVTYPNGFDCCSHNTPTGMDAGDPRLEGVKKVVEYKGGAKAGQVRLEYDPKALAGTPDADLKARVIVSADKEGVRERREYDGKSGRVSEQDIYNAEGKLDYTEGQGKDAGSDKTYSYRAWTDGSGQKIQQRFNSDNSVVTTFENAVEGQLSEKYSSIEYLPGPPPVVKGVDRDGEVVDPLPPEDLEKPVSYSVNDDTCCTNEVRADGTRVTADGDGTTTEFPPNDKDGRTKLIESAESTETQFKNGIKEVEWKDPATHGGVKKETTYPADDAQKRKVTREFDPAKGDVASETEIAGAGDQRIFERKDAAGQVIEREVTDATGRRVSGEKQGSDSEGKYTERVNAQGLTERRYENGRFVFTDSRGEVVSSGTSRRFEANGNKGVQDIDERTGQVVGMRFTEGARAGESWSLQMGPDGKVSKVTVNYPARDGVAAAEVTLTRGTDGRWSPPDANLRGFEKITGDKAELVIRPDGAVFLDHGNGIKEKITAEGKKEKFDFNEYSKEADGQKFYWNGYSWEKPLTVEKINGKVVVTFEENGDRPTKITRDPFTNKLEVEYKDGRKYDCDWNAQHITFTNKGQKQELYNSGLVENGKPVWLEGVPVSQSGGITQVQLKLDANDKKSPVELIIDGTTGKIIASYANGRQETHDKTKRVEEVTYPNRQGFSFQRDAAGEVIAATGPDGTKYTRRADFAAGPDGARVPRWNTEKDGKAGIFEGRIDCRDGQSSIESKDGTGIAVEADGRTIHKDRGAITHAVDSTGQVWKPDGPADANGDQTWTVLGDEKSKLTGKLEMLPDGRIGVKKADGTVVTRNLDKSTSVFNGDVEVERKYDPPSKAEILRNPDKTIKRTVDRDGTVRDFEYTAQAQGAPVRSKVTTTAPGGEKSVEVLINGQLRELKPGAALDSTNPSDYGAMVQYRDDGSRIARALEGTKEITLTDIHGSRHRFNEQGTPPPLESLSRNPNDNNEKVLKNGKLFSSGAIDGSFRREFVYPEPTVPPAPPASPLPTRVTDTRPGGNVVYTHTPGATPAEANLYTVQPGGEKCRFDLRTGNFTFEKKSGAGQTESLRIETADGKTIHSGPKGEPFSMLVGQDLQRVFDPQGLPRDFIYEGGKLKEVRQTRVGPPPTSVVTDEVQMIEGKPVLMAVKNPAATDPKERYEGRTTYDPVTGNRKVTVVDDAGKPVSSVEMLRNGTKVHCDATGKVFKEELPDQSVRHFEDGKLARHEFKDGSKILYDKASGNVAWTVDVNNVERFFTWQGTGPDAKIMKVQTKKLGEPIEKFVTLDERGTDNILRRVSTNAAERNPVDYNFKQPPLGSRTEVIKPGAAPNTPPAAFRADRLDGAVVTKSETGAPVETNTFLEGQKKPPEKAPEIQRGAITAKQQTDADTLARDVVAAKGVLDEALQARINKALADANLAGNRETLQAFIQNRVAAQSAYRISFQETGTGTDRKFVGAIEAVVAAKAMPVDDEIAPGRGNTADRPIPVVDLEAQERRLADVKIPDAQEGTRESADNPTLEHQRKALEAHAAKLQPKELADQLLKDMKEFEDGARRKGLSDADIAKAYYQANRLLEAKPDQLKAPLNQADATRVGLDFVHAAARSYDLGQGARESCGVKATTRQLLEKNPALAGRIVADAFLGGGQFTAPDGTVVKLDLESMKARRQAQVSVENRSIGDGNGFQTQFGDVFDHAVVNWAHQKKYLAENPGKTVEKAFYTQREPGTDQINSGERLSIPGVAETFRSGVTLSQLADLNKVLLNRKNVLTNAESDDKSKETVPFRTDAEFHTALTGALKDGPVTLRINDNHPAFTADGKRGTSDKNEWHAVTITDMKEVDGKKYFRVDNSRGAGMDRWVSEEDLYNATRTNDKLSEKPVNSLYGDARESDGRLRLGTDNRPVLEIQNKIVDAAAVPPKPDVPVKIDERPTLDRAKELFPGEKLIGMPLGEIKPGTPEHATAELVKKFYAAKTDVERQQALDALALSGVTNNASAMEAARQLSVVDAALQLKQSESGQGKQAEEMRNRALARLADLSANMPEAKTAADAWVARGANDTERAERQTQLDGAVRSSRTFAPTIDKQQIVEAQREYLALSGTSEGRQRSAELILARQAQEVLRRGQPSGELNKVNMELGAASSAMKLDGALQSGNVDQSLQALRELQAFAKAGDPTAQAVLKSFEKNLPSESSGSPSVGSNVLELLSDTRGGDERKASDARLKELINENKGELQKLIANHESVNKSLDALKIAHGDLTVRLNPADATRLTEQLRLTGDSRLKSFEEAVEKGKKQQADNKAEADTAQLKFLSREATPESRAQAIKTLEQVLDRSVGPERDGLIRTLESNRAMNGMLNLQETARGYTVESFAPIPQDPVSAERAIAGLAAIANGANGSEAQARLARQTLIQFAEQRAASDPSAPERIINALLASFDSRKSAGSLETIAAIAGKSGKMPEAFSRALEEGLTSPTLAARKAAFDALTKLPVSMISDKHVAALRQNMTPEIASNILKLPAEVLRRNQDTLIPTAIEKITQGGSRPVDVFKTSAEDLTKEIARLEQAPTRDEAALTALRQQREAALLGLAELGRGRNGDKGEATAANDALVALANANKGNKTL